MAQCGACGAERQAGTRFCRRCGREFGFEAPGPQIDTSSVPESAPVQAPPQHSSSAPPPDAIGHGPGWYAVLAGVVAVLIVAAVLGGIALTPADPDVDPAAVPTTTTQAQPGSPTTPASPRGPTRPAPTTSDEPAPNLGNDVVTVSPVPAKHSLAPLVVEIVTSYFVSINTRDFDTYRSLFTT